MSDVCGARNGGVAATYCIEEDEEDVGLHDRADDEHKQVGAVECRCGVRAVSNLLCRAVCWVRGDVPLSMTTSNTRVLVLPPKRAKSELMRHIVQQMRPSIHAQVRLHPKRFMVVETHSRTDC